MDIAGSENKETGTGAAASSAPSAQSKGLTRFDCVRRGALAFWTLAVSVLFLESYIDSQRLTIGTLLIAHVVGGACGVLGGVVGFQLHRHATGTWKPLPAVLVWVAAAALIFFTLFAGLLALPVAWAAQQYHTRLFAENEPPQIGYPILFGAIPIALLLPIQNSFARIMLCLVCLEFALLACDMWLSNHILNLRNASRLKPVASSKFQFSIVELMFALWGTVSWVAVLNWLFNQMYFGKYR